MDETKKDIHAPCKKHNSLGGSREYTVPGEDKPFFIVCFKCWAEKDTEGLKNFAE